MNLVAPPDLLGPGEYAYLQNTRRLLAGRITGRPPLGSNQLGSALPDGVTSVVRMNDTTANGPMSGYVLISGAAGNMYVNAAAVKSGLSGKPLSFLPYRPSQSPQPWCYVGDANAMWKVRSDGTIWKVGIAEPQVAPAVTVSAGSGPNFVAYRYTYRSSATGAVSNGSPESPPQTVPQTSTSGSIPASSFATNIDFNAAQYQFASGQLRTQGSVSAGTVTDYIVFHGFGLSVPAGVTIDGVLAAMNWLGQFAGTGVISAVALFYQGAIIGQIKAPGLQNQQTPSTATQGGNSDSWGTVLSPTIVNDSTFGIGFQITAQESGGSDRSFINNGTVTVYYTTLSATVTATPSSDPQVDKIDYYRMTPGLDNFTYVGTVPNSSTGFTDTFSDLDIAANPILSFENYEPFPSIDLPRSGVVNVAANGAVSWVSGDHFNVRWLPGNIILIAGVAYTLYNRPTSNTALVAVTTTTSDTGYVTTGYPPTGTNLSYEISVPELAAQPSPVIWGPTPDNAGSFYFGLDPNNPGDLLWSLGNNFDSAPDTNRLFVTSPSEPLMGGTVTSELSTVFSTDRFWLIYPNFADAVAAVTGTLGQQWTLVQSAASRGLYMRYAIGALGATIAWRAKDGICLSMGGGPEKLISEQIYNLFPHGGQQPIPVQLAGLTVFPPDDTKPDAQTISIVPGYIFYDYQDSTGTQRTLVYDVEAKGWCVDAYSPPVNCHSWAVGNVNEILAGCADGTVRFFDSTASESEQTIIATPSENGGSPRTVKRVGGVFLRALAAVGITVNFWKNRYAAQISPVTPNSIGTLATEADYLFNFTAAANADVLDLGMVMMFTLGSGSWLKEWQPDWTEMPEQIAAWRTGMLAYGLKGWLHVPWIRFAYISTTAINLTLTTDQGQVIPLSIPSSGGVPAKYFAWLPPNKFRMMEWAADAVGVFATPFTVFAAENELAIKEWGSTGPYKNIKPFSGHGFGAAASST